MRRRIRSAASPVHRHSLPQLALDAGLAALAYWLAYTLRFDNGVPDQYSQLLEATVVPVVLGNLVIFWLCGLYRRWMRYSSQRDYEAIARAVVLATVALVVYVALVRPVERTSAT